MSRYYRSAGYAAVEILFKSQIKALTGISVIGKIIKGVKTPGSTKNATSLSVTHARFFTHSVVRTAQERLWLKNLWREYKTELRQI